MNEPVLIDDRTVRVPGGRDVKLGPGLEEFRLENGGFVTRSQSEGWEMEVGWYPYPTPDPNATPVWVPVWIVRTEPGVRITLDGTRREMALPKRVAHLPGPAGSVTQDGDRFIVVVVGESEGRNIYAYDADGALRWRIGAPPLGVTYAEYSSIDNIGGTLKALNQYMFTATVDRDTGNVVQILKQPW